MLENSIDSGKVTRDALQVKDKIIPLGLYNICLAGYKKQIRIIALEMELVMVEIHLSLDNLKATLDSITLNRQFTKECKPYVNREDHDVLECPIRLNIAINWGTVP